MSQSIKQLFQSFILDFDYGQLKPLASLFVNITGLAQEDERFIHGHCSQQRRSHNTSHNVVGLECKVKRLKEHAILCISKIGLEGSCSSKHTIE